MNGSKLTKDEQIRKLKSQLIEAEENLEAIRSGTADAIVVHTDAGISIFTIQGAETAYRIMVETMNEGAFTVDSGGVILYVNARFSSMLGFPSSLLVGKRIQTFVAQGQKNDFERFIKKTVTGATVHHDFRFVKRDTSILPLYLSSAPLEIIGRHDICIIASDLTERYTAQHKLIELNNSLEKKVKERTNELESQKLELERSQEQLKKLASTLEQQVEHRTLQARDLAKALSLAEQRQRQRFSLILHEDLQQVLFSIKARFGLLKDIVDDGAKEDFISDIEDLENLTSKALATTKRLAIEFNPPVLRNEGLDAALKWLAHHMESQYGLKVNVNIPEGFRGFRADERVLLVQLIQELLLNVIKHAETGKAGVTVKHDQNHIYIEVQDKGVGFDLKKVKKTARKKTHMGLLSIEERLRLFGGSFRIESNPGKGTRITMTLPYDPKIKQLSLE